MPFNVTRRIYHRHQIRCTDRASTLSKCLHAKSRRCERWVCRLYLVCDHTVAAHLQPLGWLCIYLSTTGQPWDGT